MQFTISDDAVSRLRLDPDLKGRVFDGPRLDRGYLGAYTTAEKRWARKVFFKGDNLEDVSEDELEPLYFFLAVRRTGAALLPEKVFVELAPADFEIVPHEYVGELTVCLSCGMPYRTPVHELPDEDDALA